MAKNKGTLPSRTADEKSRAVGSVVYEACYSHSHLIFTESGGAIPYCLARTGPPKDRSRWSPPSCVAGSSMTFCAIQG